MENSKDFISKIGSSIHSMSFIIGAGFSKNISDKYLSWPELLDDMINEMYSKEMALFDLNKRGIIDKYGYLGIASEYIRRKGYHEAIDIYIEQRTPILVEKEDGTYDLFLGKEHEENVDVSLHRRLLDMKVKNIYTFNYDNALEVYSDLTSTSERRRELEGINEEKRQIDEALLKLKQLYSEAKKEEKVDTDGIELYTTRDDNIRPLNEFKNLPIVKRICDIFDINDEDINDLEFAKEVNDKLEIYRQQLWDSVKQWNKIRAEAYYVVKKSGDITISAGRNIFKLHGSLRELKERDEKYGFDYDSHTQYIIAQEDYDTYNERHEAFVDLMRISLLKDSYCIVGFSCDDPNFLLWINWVKDIVDKEKLEGEDKDNLCNKYFINVDDTSLDAAKTLLLSNHYINVVDLYKIYPSAKSGKERLSAFFDDIEKMQSPHATDQEFWEHFNFSQSHSPKEERTVEYDANKIDRAWNLTKKDELSFFASPSDYYRFFFLEKVRGVIIDRKMDAYVSKAFAMAANQDNLPLNVIFDDEQKLNYIMNVVSCANDAELKQFYDVMTEQWMLLENQWKKEVPNTSDRSILNQCMTCLFNFDFDSCYRIANEWKPVGEYYKVIQLMIITEQKRKLESVDVVFACTERQLYNTDQEYLIALEQLLGFQQFFWVNHEADAKLEGMLSKIDELTKNNRGLLRLHDYFSKLKKALYKEEKVKPLGREGRTITFGSSDTETLGAIRILQVIVKLGFVTDRMLSRWFTDKNFYDVIEKTYTLYPYPCLYYASLSTDKNMSKRVAQLYCNSSSDIIQKALPDILAKILKACGSKNLSEERKNTLYIYASSFIKRVHPKVWMKEFKKLYKTQGLDSQSEREFFTAKYDFAQQAISYSKDNAFKQEIIVGILRRWENLTHYDNSLLIAATRNLRALDKTVLRQVYQVMNYERTYFPSLYPIEGANILIMYAQSLKQYISSVLSEQLCDKNTDIVQLLTRYTSALLLLMSKKDCTNYFVSKPVTAEYIKAIEERRDNLKEAAESIKQHNKIADLYPYIKDVDFNSLLENYIQQMKSINDMPILKEQGGVVRKKVGCNIVKKIYKLFSGNSTNIVSVKDLYRMSLNNVIIDDLKNRFTQFERDALRYIPKGLFVEDARNKNEEGLVNPCQLLVHKLMFLDAKSYNCGRNIYYDFVELISTRFVYLALCAFRKMNMHKETLKVSDFDLFFEKFTHGKTEDYVLIGIATPFDAILNTTRVRKDVFYRQTVPYIEIEAIGKYDLLNDLESFDFFKGSLLIIAKSDLPSIVDSTNENISFDFKEECDKSKMKMNVRTTVDVHKKVLFNKMADIAVVKIKPMSL